MMALYHLQSSSTSPPTAAPSAAIMDHTSNDNQKNQFSLAPIPPAIIIPSNDHPLNLNHNINELTFSIEDFEIASKAFQRFLTLLYSLTAALALIGNILSIFVLIKGKRSSRDLRLFLVNLSLSDILMAIFSIPFTYTDFIMGRWIFDPRLCPIVQSMQIVSVFVSIYTLTTIGIDRYIAIMKPFMVNFWTKSFAPMIVALTWLTGAALGLFIWFYSHAESFQINNITYYDCRESWNNKHDEQIYTIALFLLVFALPLLCLMFFYGSICLKLWYHCAPGNANAVRDNAQYQAKKKVTKVILMLITIVALFAICWFPSHLFQLIRVFNEDFLMWFIGNDASSPKYLAIVIISHWLSMAHSFVNPIIYSFMSDNFKADIRYMGKQLMKKQNPCHQSRRHRNYNHHHQQNRNHFDTNQNQIRMFNDQQPDDTMDSLEDDDDDDDGLEDPSKTIKMVGLTKHNQNNTSGQHIMSDQYHLRKKRRQRRQIKQLKETIKNQHNTQSTQPTTA